MFNIASFVDLENWIARVWQGQRVLIKPWAIDFSFGNIASGTTGSVTQKINSNADFVLSDYRFSYGEGGGGDFAEVLLQIVDNGSLERFFADEVPLIIPAKNMSDPFVSSTTTPSTFRRIAGNSSVTATLRHPAGGTVTANDVHLLMIGVLVFTYSQSVQR